MCTALINRISLVGGMSTRPPVSTRPSRFFCRPAIVARRMVRFCRQRDMELTPNFNRWQIFSISLFYCFPINQFRRSSNRWKQKKNKKTPNELISHQAKCVLMTSAHIPFAQKAKGLISTIYPMGLQASPLNNKHRQMDTWGQNSRPAHMYLKC